MECSHDNLEVAGSSLALVIFLKCSTQKYLKFTQSVSFVPLSFKNKNQGSAKSRSLKLATEILENLRKQTHSGVGEMFGGLCAFDVIQTWNLAHS